MMQATIYTDGNPPAPEEPACVVSTNSQCGMINGVHTTCPDDKSCSSSGWCGTTFAYKRNNQDEFSYGNCPDAASFSMLSTLQMALGENQSLLINAFALIGLLTTAYIVTTTISNRFKSYERVDVVCDSEI